jgi:hypothetical protein
MILLEVHPVCISIDELEGYAPGAIDVNSVTRGNKTSQRMKVETRHIHILNLFSGIKCIKSLQNPLMHSAVDFRRSIFQPKRR